ncbi:hypothetical protein D3C77_748090 [compost metagenome]
MSDIYHRIETKTYSASQGYKELMALKKTLQERRKIKNEHHYLRVVIDSHNIEKTFSKFNAIKDRMNKNLQATFGGFTDQITEKEST